MIIYSITRKPCDQITGVFAYGVITCNLLTRRRVLEPGIFSVDCGMHKDEEIEDYEEPVYDYVLGTNDRLSTRDRWVEVEVSDCRFGCRIYENQRTGRRALVHSSDYDCEVQR